MTALKCLADLTLGVRCPDPPLPGSPYCNKHEPARTGFSSDPFWPIRADRDYLLRVLSGLPRGSVDVLDKELHRLFCAGEGFAEVGLDPRSLVGQKLDASLPPGATLDDPMPFFQSAFSGDSPDFEYTYGGERYLISVRPFDMTESAVSTILVVTQNVTEYRAASRETIQPREISGMVGIPEDTRPNRYGLTYGDTFVLSLLAQGLGNQEIADASGLSLAAIRKQISEILMKLGAGSRKEARVRAIREGLI